MKAPRIFLAAAAVAMLSTAAYASPPSADQVSVPPGAEMGHHGNKMKALFSSPEELMMFRMQMRQATGGMTHAQKKAWRKDQSQKIRAMNDSEKAAWRQSLDAQWNALPAERRNRMEARMQRHEQRHQAHMQGDQSQSGNYAPPPPQQ
jgi:hypothetical protein